MKYRYKIVLNYDGKDYYGWNKQPNFPTIEGALGDALYFHTKSPAKISVASRTDRYVHAKKQICCFDLDFLIPNLKSFQAKLNAHLPAAIQIQKITKVAKEFSPRYDIQEKTYLYKICINNNQDQKKENYQYNYFYDLNLKSLKKDAKLFLGEKNFASFTAKQEYDNYVRTINKIKVYKRSNYIYIKISGKSFMRFMVRNIVGVLLAKNRGKYSEEQFLDLFLNPQKGKANYKAPGCGLYLKKLKY